MRLHLVIHVLGLLLIFLAVAMLLPIPFSLYYGGGDYVFFLIASGITLVSGFLFFKLTRLDQEVHAREAFAIVTLGWVLFSLFGCLPFLLSGAIPNFTNAFFETMSGFTTTGATILEDIEVLPHGLLFWRSLTHWLGGMGIIVLSIAILPLLGVGGMQLFKAEAPGPAPDKLTPRVTETAKILWGIYVLISALETVFLMIGGMTLFDALCHTFGTMATGGFSTKNASIGHYTSPYIQYVIIVFMLLAGTSFSLHYKFLKKKFDCYRKNHEFNFFMLLVGGATMVIGFNTFLHHFPRLETAFRTTLFQVVSILTTTGFVTADYEQWSVTSQFILFLFMFIGGCAGSTGGGMKVIRLVILLQFVRAEVKRLLHRSQCPRLPGPHAGPLYPGCDPDVHRRAGPRLLLRSRGSHSGEHRPWAGQCGADRQLCAYPGIREVGTDLFYVGRPTGDLHGPHTLRSRFLEEIVPEDYRGFRGLSPTFVWDRSY
jgi:trk system potassium uptake protein TrkH